MPRLLASKAIQIITFDQSKSHLISPAWESELEFVFWRVIVTDFYQFVEAFFDVFPLLGGPGVVEDSKVGVQVQINEKRKKDSFKTLSQIECQGFLV